MLAARKGYETLSEDCELSPEPDKIPEKQRRWCPLPWWFTVELQEVFKLAWPVAVTNILQFSLGPISLMFCGHLGTIALAGAALANSVINVTGISIGTGLSTACDTLFSQTFGSDNKKGVGIYLQRGMIIQLLFLFPCWAIHINTEALLILIQQDPEASKIAAEYIMCFIPGLLSVFVFQVLCKYLQNQNIVYPTMVVAFAGNCVNAICHYLLIYVAGYETSGSAISQVIAFTFMAVLTLGYIIAMKLYTETWDGFTTDAFRDWAQFIKLAVPGLLMICLEWWSFEIGTFMTGILGEVQLGAQSIMFQMESMAYMIPLGISIACCIRVGQFLGGQDTVGAKKSCAVGLVVISVTSILTGILIACLRFEMPKMWTNDPRVIQYAGNTLPILALFQFFDGIAGVSGGILRGCGRQFIGAVAIFIGYYIIALPIGIPLMFHTYLEAAGLWWGLTIGLVLEAGLFVLLIVRTDWDKEVYLAQERAGYVEPISRRQSIRYSVDLSQKQYLTTGFNRQASIKDYGSESIPPTIPEKAVVDNVEEDPPCTRDLFLNRLFIILATIFILVIAIIIRVNVDPDTMVEHCTKNRTTALITGQAVCRNYTPTHHHMF